ncbi:MAG: plastocyanin/azurin family copper-binding protein [Actinomycetota bacterium]
MRGTVSWAVSIVMLVVLGGACASGRETPEGVDKTIVVSMRDSHFEPDSIDIDVGDTVEFHFANDGATRHDAFIGDEKAQAEHEREMRAADDAEHGGGHAENEPGALTLEPDERGMLTHTFDKAGTYEIGCHEPGHYAAGMKLTIDVR